MWTIAALGMFLLPVSCDKPEPITDPGTDPDPEETEIVVTGTFGAFTKAAAGTGDLKFAWNEGDRISLFYTPEGYDEDKLANADFHLSTVNADKTEGSFKATAAPAWKDDAVSHKFYAVYPYNSANTDLTAVKVVIPTSQPVSADELFPGAFMTASKSVAEVADNVTVEFTSPLAFVKLVIDAAGTAINGEELEEIVFGSDLNISGNATYNVLTGAMSEFDAKEIAISYEGGNVVEDVVEAYFVVDAGADLSAGNANVTVSMEGPVFTGKIDVAIEKSLTAGALNLIEVKLKDAVDNGMATITIDDQLITDLSNSYIVKPGSRITFPVKQAYNAWANYIQEPIAADVALTCKLLWMDTPGGLSRTSAISFVSMHKATEGENAGISVKTGSAEGNAVIALMANGTIVWSWHIWVTDYDPSATFGQSKIGEFTLMDRNIGALNKTPGDINSQGLSYEWGRKDPFPSSDGVRQVPNYMGNPYRDIWDGEGELLTMGEGGTGISIGIPIYSDEKDGIAYSINNPTLFLTGAGGANPTAVFWTSNSQALNPGTLKNDLWGGNNSFAVRGAKTVFDPCPTGWRVPHSPDIATALKEKGGSLTVGATGLDFGEYGYYPLSGMIQCDGETGGTWIGAGYTGGFWLDWPGGFGGRIVRYFSDQQVGDPADAIFRSYGVPVRCEKDE